MLTLSDILHQSPNVPGYGGGQWAMYSVNCCWWTSFPDDLGSTESFTQGKLTLFKANKEGESTTVEADFPPLPCCPHCGSVLFQAPLKAFIDDAKSVPNHYGKHGIDAFVRSHHRNSSTCHKSWSAYNDSIDKEQQETKS